MNFRAWINTHLYSAAALLLATALLLCCGADYLAACRNVRDGVLRMHVTANSDSAADQAVKLKVRDALLAEGAACFENAGSAAEAEAALTPALPMLEETARRVLRENGFAYGAKAEITSEYFDTRSYGDVTLPAGRYRAIRITLGTGKGRNWWCVMFPPLCLPAAEGEPAEDVYALPGAAAVIRPENGYEIRFRIAELVQELWHKWTEQ